MLINIKSFKLSSNKLLYIFSVFLFFCYIYRLKLNGLFFSTTTFLAIIGSVLILGKYVNSKKLSVKSDKIIFFIGCLLPFSIALLSSFVNSEADFNIFKDIIGIPYYLLSFYCIKIYRIKTKQELNFNCIAMMYILTGLFQCFISLIGFIIPNIGSFLVKIQDLGSQSSTILHYYNYRLIGLGTQFWGAGVVFSLDLILIAQLLSEKKIHKENYYNFLPFCYLTIFVIGMMMSRTTIIGFVFSLFFLFRLTIKKIFKLFLPPMLLLSLLAFLLINYYSEKIQIIFNFGYDILINYNSGNGVQNESIKSMFKMYRFPEFDNYKTWLIGDGLFLTPDRHYYKKTDIGYCRAIYYFGLLGLFSLFISQTFILLLIKRRLDNKYCFFFCILGFMFLVFNLKGFILIHTYIIPFYFVDKSMKYYNYQ